MCEETKQRPIDLLAPDVHADWYADGIEEGRDLWRLDLPDVQIQVSLNVINIEDEKDGEPPQYGDQGQIFIEHDVRGGGPNGDDRTKYSSDGFNASKAEIMSLLAGNKHEVGQRLFRDIQRTKDMPNQEAT